MAISLEMLIILHKKSKEKINLTYKKPSGKIGTCFFDTTKDIVYSDTWSRPNPRTLFYENKVYVHPYAAVVNNQNFYYFRFTKHNTNSHVYVKLSDVDFASYKKETMLRLIYEDV